MERRELVGRADDRAIALAVTQEHVGHRVVELREVQAVGRHHLREDRDERLRPLQQHGVRLRHVDVLHVSRRPREVKDGAFPRKEEDHDGHDEPHRDGEFHLSDPSTRPRVRTSMAFLRSSSSVFVARSRSLTFASATIASL